MTRGAINIRSRSEISFVEHNHGFTLRCQIIDALVSRIYIERSRRQHMDAGSSMKIESIEIINKKTLVQETPLFKTTAF